MTSTASISAPLSAEAAFDSVGPAYEVAFEGLETQLASIKWIVEQLGQHKPAKVLDIGCGAGRPVCSELAAAGHDVLGIDISSNMLGAARKNVPQARFEQKDIRDFEAAPGSFDAITVYFSLIASVTQDEIRDFIKRIHGWLRAGGIFVLGTASVDGNNIEMRWMGRPVVCSGLSAEDTVSWMREVGFEVVHEDQSTFTPRAVEAGICEAEDVWEEPHLFVYARRQ
ncbi:S-adenosyl-L-methionine-dependent methyltransferase [Rhizodiscina lignyota]|uniref:S-adenosyl-L-methionine-dependent methyltransferase n=1 Tax=Rhizodiscina lignyota TaxID=1504668 RepID=A0A9P4IAZ9_9PEZI|nr:S-adenosyl-L-methionine-dependent methyltransferase [Rhizodiscina lignyota]